MSLLQESQETMLEGHLQAKPGLPEIFSEGQT